MLITFCIKKEDIETTPIGYNYQIKTREGILLNFDDEAIDDLIKDVTYIRGIKGGAGKCWGEPTSETA
jgi:hypothetical protein